MLRRYIQLIFVAIFLAGIMVVTKTAMAQYPSPAPLNRPDYNYSEANGCTRCHFIRGPGGDHMLEAVGVSFDDVSQKFSFTGNGWFASPHATTNYKSTQNTYCAKCHSPLQAKSEASFKKGRVINAEPVPDGSVEGVTCAMCHPSHNSAVILGRRLGIYKFEMDRSTPEAYDVVEHGKEDQLCLTCHVNRHNEDSREFRVMYNVGVRCVDCHMAVYGHVEGTEVEKRFHDFKVAKNLPYSCGAQGSVVVCHPGMTTEGALQFIPKMKKQHKTWWPDPAFKGMNHQ